MLYCHYGDFIRYIYIYTWYTGEIKVDECIGPGTNEKHDTKKSYMAEGKINI